ncbi:unnamed protein product, partial [Prorocentrum cordatum]
AATGLPGQVATGGTLAAGGPLRRGLVEPVGLARARRRTRWSTTARLSCRREQAGKRASPKVFPPPGRTPHVPGADRSGLVGSLPTPPIRLDPISKGSDSDSPSNSDVDSDVSNGGLTGLPTPADSTSPDLAADFRREGAPVRDVWRPRGPPWRTWSRLVPARGTSATPEGGWHWPSRSCSRAPDTPDGVFGGRRQPAAAAKRSRRGAALCPGAYL